MKKIRRLVSFILVAIIQKLRVAFYRYVLSNNEVKNISSKIFQPVRFVGRGDIVLDNCAIGVYSSPSFLSGSGYIEARKKGALVTVGAGTHINNNVSIIANDGAISIGCNCLIGLDVSII